MKIKERWEEMKEKSHANIQSEKGILNRQIRSIQTEGHFGDIKQNDGFRRFNHRSVDKVQKEFMLYAISRNINKYHRFLCKKLRKFEGRKEENAAQDKRGISGRYLLFCALKNNYCSQKQGYSAEYDSAEKCAFCGVSLFLSKSGKIGISRFPRFSLQIHSIYHLQSSKFSKSNSGMYTEIHLTLFVSASISINTPLSDSHTSSNSS